jgi:hypothetical protein
MRYVGLYRHEDRKLAENKFLEGQTDGTLAERIVLFEGKRKASDQETNRIRPIQPCRWKAVRTIGVKSCMSLGA